MSEIRRTGSEDQTGFDMREFAPVPDGVTCLCGRFIPDDAEDEEAHKVNGVWYCGECFAELPAAKEQR